MRTIPQVSQAAGQGSETGLSADQAAESRRRFGANRLTPLPREPLWKKFVEKFDEPIIKILLAAALLSMVVDMFKPPLETTRFTIGGIAVALIGIAISAAYFLRRSALIPTLLFLSALILFPVGLATGHASYDGLAVMVAVILATGVAFISEYKSDREFELLNSHKDSLQVKVMRGGDIHALPLEEVVVGDLVLLETGDEIPADGRITKASDLYIDQSLMTGESEPVKKQARLDDAAEGPDQPGCVYRGTQVVDGVGQMAVMEVGDATYLGQIARRLSSQEDDVSEANVTAETNEQTRVQRKLTVSKELTPLQVKLQNLAELISKVGYVAAIAIFLALLVRGLIVGEVRWPHGSPRTVTLHGPASSSESLLFSPDGSLFALAGWTTQNDRFTGQVRLWNTGTGQELPSLLGHNELIYAAAFSPPTGKHLATGAKDGTIIVWQTGAQNPWKTFAPANTFAGGITKLAFSPAGDRLASASRDGVAKVWPISLGTPAVTFAGHRGEVLGVAFHSDGKSVFSWGEDRLIKQWDASSGAEMLTVHGQGDDPVDKEGTLAVHDAAVANVVVGPDGRWLVSHGKSYDRKSKKEKWELKTIDLEKNQVLRTWDKNPDEITALMPFDSDHVAVGTSDAPVVLLNVRTGETKTVEDQDFRGAQAISGDGRQFARRDNDQRILLAGGPEDFAGVLLNSAANLLGYFMYMVIIIVVAVPEGLPMSVTVSLALAMRKMTRANSLVRQLVACETIGSATVICSDKTGTLTQNKMRVVRLGSAGETLERGKGNGIVPPRELGEMRTGKPIEWIALNAAVNSTAHLEFKENQPITVGNSTEGSLLQWLHEGGVEYQKLRLQHEPLYQIHFSSERKRMTSVVRVGGRMAVLVKGAPEWVLEKSTHFVDAEGQPQPWNPAARAAVQQNLAQAASEAMRTLAFGHASLPEGQSADEDSLHSRRDHLEKDLVFAGFVAIRDPLREDVKEAVDQCRRAGIEVKMITGDNVEIARAIGAEIGLLDDRVAVVMTSKEFNELSDEQVKDVMPRLRILARARPLDKYRIVKLLQEQGEVVAVTGDGTNDAPALKKADVGLAMGRSGTEVAKEASKIVLLDDAFSTIVKAVHWGRSLYENIQRFIQFQLTINVSALVIAFLGPFFGVRPPFTILQLLWINVIMDTLASIALCSEPPRPGLMRMKPKRRDENILTQAMMRTILMTAGFFIVVMMTFLLGLENGWWLRDPGGARSKSFPELTYWQVAVFFSVYVFFQIWNEINCRSLTPERSGLTGVLKNPVFMAIAGLIVVGQIAIVMFGGDVFEVAPLSPFTWACIIVATSSVLLFAEVSRRIRLLK